MRMLLILTVVFSFAAFAKKKGDGVNNGGDAIFCYGSTQNDFDGTYSLDYLLTADSPRVSVKVQSYEESLARIERLLRDKVPSVAESFADFRATVFNETDLTKARLWEPIDFGLIDLKDEKMTSQIPENCKFNGETRVIQAVIRLSPEFSGSENLTIYKFVPSVMAELEVESPLQLSYLLVHEWLWDISSDVEHNRQANRLLHSAEFESMSPEEAERVLLIEQN